MGGSNGTALLELRTSQPSVFDFTSRIREVCVDVCVRTPDLAHVRLGEVAIGYRQTRKAGRYGVQATLTPMRFEAGSLTHKRRGQTWTLQRLYGRTGREMLYILSFYLPRFLDLPFSEKLITIFHELWHIAPAFDGDIRRGSGRCYAHTGGQRHFDELADRLAKRWLQAGPPRELYDFLELNFEQLRDRHGRIVGTKIPTPRLIPLSGGTP
ncbi:MAG: hypothetical protein HYS13_15035 [Planctomycetia bacterium]|nr:hypothetical protein [Planctomycetia bacterium]